MEVFLFYFLLFMIYSFIGWIIDVLSALIENPKLINRGFLIGPYCPIYGVASIIMIFYLSQYKDNIFTVFLLAILICSFIEYITGYLMEKLFNARWWDYSKHKFHLNGRVCLSNAIIFATAGVILVCFLNPFLTTLIKSLPILVINIISIILLIVFVIDLVLSFNITYKITRTAKNVVSDSTEEISKAVKEILGKKLFQRRIFEAFPKFEFIDNIKKRINPKND